MRVLVFGDSIAEGMWDTHGGWVQRLRTHYDTKHLVTKTDQPEVINVSISGDRTQDVIDRLINEARFREWNDEDFVLVLAVGINDSAIVNGKEITPIDDFVAKYDQLLKEAYRLTGRVLIIGLTPVDEDAPTVKDPKYAYNNERITNYNDELKQLAGDDVTFVELLQTFTDKLAKGAELLSDGLHPNDAGHELIAATTLPVLDALIAAKAV
jgi:lysophospholipase L1-like esterase